MTSVVIPQKPYGPGNEDYEHDRAKQEAPVIRFSHLRAFGRSGAHGQHALSAEAQSTPAMQVGTAVHAMLFKTRKVCAYPGAVRRGKEYEAFVASHADCEILTMNDYERAAMMVDAVKQCKLAEPLLQGRAEETLLFRWMGLDCRATPDVRGNSFITELKTSATSDPTRFLWHARRMAYHAQLRFQKYACAFHDYPMKDHYIVCVEATEPFPVTVFHVEPEALEEGEKLLTLWAERLKNCLAADIYPPYVDCIVPLVWPKDDVIEFGDEA